MEKIQEDHDKRMEKIRIKHELFIQKIGIEIQAIRADIPKRKLYFGKVKIE